MPGVSDVIGILSFSVWPCFLSMIISKAIHVAEKCIASFKWLRNALLYMCITLLYPSLWWRQFGQPQCLGYFQASYTESQGVCFSLGFSIQAQEWDCCIMSLLLISFFLRNLHATHKGLFQFTFPQTVYMTSFLHTHSSICCYRVFWWWWVWSAWVDNRHCSFAFAFL